MKNLVYIYMCRIKSFALTTILIVAFGVSANAQVDTKVSESTPPMLIQMGNDANSQEKAQASDKDNVVLFHSKILLEKEKEYNNIRASLNAFKCDELVNATIRNMYLPANEQRLPCDISMPESFDKSTLPDNVKSYREEILTYITQDVLSELSFCLGYMGIQMNDQDLFTFYVAPYKMNLIVFKRTRLQGRELAWLIANDFKQSVCEQNPQVFIPKDKKESIENRMTK